MRKKVLILCTGNSCRSQMAEGFLKSFDSEMEVYSAGTNPASRVSRNSIKVMSELGIDISNNSPKNVSVYLKDSFDYVITVCDNAKKTCPVFFGKAGETLHIGFDDPADATGSEKEIISEYRRIRDEIKRDFMKFYKGLS